jgi:archaellin
MQGDRPEVGVIWALVLLALVLVAAVVLFTSSSSKGGGKPSSTQTGRPAVTTGAEAAA